jgi:hypothetical protein
MLIAKVENEQVLDVADYKSMFPNTSFSANGIHESFYAENGLMPVNLFKPYDHATEQLVPCEPYIEDGQVYTMRVEPLPVVIDDLIIMESIDSVIGA